MQAALGVVVLAGEAQVEGGELAIALGVLVGLTFTEGAAGPLPDHGLFGVGSKPWGVEVVAVALVVAIAGVVLCRVKGKSMTLTPLIQNKKIKEFRKQVYGLKPEDQEIVCHFLDVAVKQDQLKKLVIRP